MEEINLNAPAFGEGSQKVEEVETVTEAPAETSEETQAEVEEKEEVVEPSEEESKVPYSRFKKFHDLATEKEKEAEYWRGVAEGKGPTVQTETNDAPPDFWVKLYGDSDESREAWNVQKEQNERILEQAKEEAVRAVREEREQEVTALKQNEESLDGHLEEVSAVAGRTLTDKEQSAVLDIIDDYTPKDEDGNYVGALISPDKAWEIYELKQQALNGPRKKSRDSVASLSGSQTQGQPDLDKQERDKNWNPMNWMGYKDRLKE